VNCGGMANAVSAGRIASAMNQTMGPDEDGQEEQPAA